MAVLRRPGVAVRRDAVGQSQDARQSQGVLRGPKVRQGPQVRRSRPCRYGWGAWDEGRRGHRGIVLVRRRACAADSSLGRSKVCDRRSACRAGYRRLRRSRYWLEEVEEQQPAPYRRGEARFGASPRAWQAKLVWAREYGCVPPGGVPGREQAWVPLRQWELGGLARRPPFRLLAHRRPPLRRLQEVGSALPRVAQIQRQLEQVRARPAQAALAE